METCDPQELKGENSVLAKDLVQDPACLPETILPIPDELREKAGKIEGQVEEKTSPDPISIWNHPCIAECDAPSTGASIPIEEYTYTEEIYFSQVAAIKENALEYIARNNLEPTIAQMWHAGELTIEWLHRNTGMANSQARALLKLMKQAQERVDSLACAKAQSLLVCEWCNTAQYAQCQDEGMVKEGIYNGKQAIFYYEVESCAVTSTVSQEDADRKAQLLAESMLHCFYINEPCTATCETRPDRPLDIMDPVPNDTEPIYPGRSLRVGTYTVNEGLFTSYESQSAANEQACAAANSMLNCWYPNCEIYAACDSADARDCSLYPEPAHPANIVDMKAGQSVAVPSGFIVSELSYEDATEQAETLAETLLECCYVNDKVEVSCDIETVTTDNCETYEVEANPDKGVTHYEVPEGAFLSSVSKEEANMFAMQSTEGQLECIYCNKRIMPTCVPEWVTTAVLKGRLSLPLDREVITDGVYSVKTSTLPPEATLGAEEGDYCASEAQQAYRLAVSASNSTAAAQCVYLNDEVVLACSSQDRYNAEAQVYGGILYYREKPDTLEPYYFFTLYDPNRCLSSMSLPPQGEYITVPAGLFSGPDKQIVDQQAIEFAHSLMRCVWTNPTFEAACEWDEEANEICDGWKFGKSMPFYNLTPWSTKGSHPVVFSSGIITYIGNGDDEQLALNYIKHEARDIAQSALICYYGNEAQVGHCEGIDQYPKYTYYIPEVGPALGWEKIERKTEPHSGVVPAMTVVADSVLEANNMALAMAKSLAVCDEDTTITYNCVPALSSSPSKPTPTSTVIPTPTPIPSPTPIPIPTLPNYPVPSGCFNSCPYYSEECGLSPATLSSPGLQLVTDKPFSMQMTASQIVEMKLDNLSAQISLFDGKL